MTKEQEIISRRNKTKLRKRLGIYGQTHLCLHHIDPNWKTQDIERYIQWNIEDVVIMTMSEHTRWHNLHRDEEIQIKISNTLRGRPHTEEHKKHISEAIKALNSSTTS